MEIKYNKDINKLPDISPKGTKYVTKISYSPDLHVPHRERRNRNNLIKNALQVLDEYAQVVKDNKCDAVILGGDISNQGWDNISMEFIGDIGSRLNKLNKIVNDNLFAVLGNHEVTYRKNNMFYAFSSLDCDLVKEQVSNFTVPNLIYPFIKTPSCIDLGKTKIYLMHYDKFNRYKILDNSDSYIIGIYHTDIVTFESEQELYHHRLGHGIRVTDTDLLENVNWAICGHIHKPLQTIILDNTKNTIIDVPGVLLPNTIDELHGKVNLPFICIDENGEVFREYLEFITGDSNGTVNKEIVAEDNTKKMIRKLISQEKKIEVYEDFKDYLSQINDLEVRDAIVNADNLIVPKCCEMFEELSKNW